MTELADELFKETFSSLRNALLKTASSPVRRKNATSPEDSYGSIDRLLAEGAEAKVKARLDHYRMMREAHMTTLGRVQQQAQLASTSIDTAALMHTEKCRTHLASSMDALHSHESSSHRRMKELTYELTGEYAKSFIRASRRYDLVSIADCKSMSLLVMQLRWKRFIFKFLSTVTLKIDDRKKGARDSILGEALSLHDHHPEIKIVLDAVRKRLSAEAADEADLTAVVRFERVPSKDRTGANPSLIPLLASNPAEFAKFEAELISWISPPPRSAALQQPVLARARSGSNILPEGKEKTTAPTGGINGRLQEFLQASNVEWLCPVSHYPNIWDDILDESAANTTTVVHATGRSAAPLEGTSNRMAFSKKFSLQHTAGMASNRLYFCLEERFLWSKSPQSISIDGAEEQKFPVLALLSYLQSIYARRTVFTDDQVLAAELDGVLDVFEFVGDHRDLCSSRHTGGAQGSSTNGCVGGNAPPTNLNVTFVDLASIFPDIIRAKTRSGFIVHFAPAMMVNMLESSLLTALSPSSDYVRRICVEDKCPHPWLIRLLSTGSGGGGRGARSFPIRRLYALSRPPRLLASSRSQQRTQSELSNMLAPPTASIDTASSPIDIDATASDAAQGCVFLVPLSNVCYEELFRSYFGDDGSVAPDGSSERSSHYSNAAYILPDHCRLYYNPTRQKAAGDERGPLGAMACPSCDANGAFHHTYMLLAVQTTPDAAQVKPTTNSIGKYSRDSIDGKIHRIQHSKSNSSHGDMGEQNINASSGKSVSIASSKYYMLQFRRKVVTSTDPFDSSNSKAARAELQVGHGLSSLSSIRYGQWGCDQRLFDQIMEENEHESVMLSRNESKISISSTAVDSDVEQKKGWDSSIISSLCRWRSCLCESSSSSMPKHLCTYHSELKKCLDHLSANGIDGSLYDSSKYMPKKVPNIPLSTPDRDLQIIRAASSLVQESGDGKLRHTVLTYMRRMIADMSLRSRVQSYADWYTQRMDIGAAICGSSTNLNSSASVTSKLQKQRRNSFLSTPDGKSAAKYLPVHLISPKPSWAKWKNTDLLKSEIESLGAEHNLLQELSKYEQQTSAELLVLGSLNLFPSQEISMIKRDVQTLRDQPLENRDSVMSTGDGDTTNVNPSLVAIEQEIRVAEKKAMLFRTRRLDEERLMGQQVSAAAAGMQYNIEHDGERQSHSGGGGGGGYRRPARDTSRF